MNQEQLETLVMDQLAEQKAFLVDLSMGTNKDIKVFADLNEGNISIAQLRSLSRAIEGALGEASEDYSIEVSSPGAFKPWQVPQQYQKNIGNKVVVTLIDGTQAKGAMTDFQDDVLTLTWKERVPKPVGKGKMTQEMTRSIAMEEVKQTVLDFKF